MIIRFGYRECGIGVVVAIVTEYVDFPDLPTLKRAEKFVKNNKQIIKLALDLQIQQTNTSEEVIYNRRERQRTQPTSI